MSNKLRQTIKNQEKNKGNVAQLDRWDKVQEMIVNQLTIIQMYAMGMQEITALPLSIIRCIENQAEVTASIEVLSRDATRIRDELIRTSNDIAALGNTNRAVAENEMQFYLETINTITALANDQMTLCDPMYRAIDAAIREARSKHSEQLAKELFTPEKDAGIDIVDVYINEPEVTTAPQ